MSKLKLVDSSGPHELGVVSRRIGSVQFRNLASGRYKNVARGLRSLVVSWQRHTAATTAA